MQYKFTPSSWARSDGLSWYNKRNREGNYGGFPWQYIFWFRPGGSGEATFHFWAKCTIYLNFLSFRLSTLTVVPLGLWLSPILELSVYQQVNYLISLCFQISENTKIGTSKSGTLLHSAQEPIAIRERGVKLLKGSDHSEKIGFWDLKIQSDWFG